MRHVAHEGERIKKRKELREYYRKRPPREKKNEIFLRKGIFLKAHAKTGSKCPKRARQPLFLGQKCPKKSGFLFQYVTEKETRWNGVLLRDWEKNPRKKGLAKAHVKKRKKRPGGQGPGRWRKMGQEWDIFPALVGREGAGKAAGGGAISLFPD